MYTLTIFLPLFAAIIIGLNSRNVSDRFAQITSTCFLFISAILSAVIFHEVVLSEGNNNKNILIASWFASGDFIIDWRLKIDVLTSSMMVLVTFVSALVHLYSIGYMNEDPHKPRFMAYLSLFTFFMLMLVTSNNFIQLFLGWEGVGLCSYLLIGFWYKKKSANDAAMKAFIVNRVGDFGLALGVFAIFLVFGSVEFDTVFSQVDNFKETTINFLGFELHAITLICILLFIGCMGKSAQLLLHTWLPDAMEGPTPVSALIHAATMVTAGVFLIARCSPLFELAPIALDIVTIVGAFTAIFAATIALTQNDIKRVIAYSTCSQLGYMFFACGVSAYSAGVFHLLTHGFFKALLFLGAGSVIHAMHHEQDMRKMGGIWKKIPLTYAVMIIGTLAITGFPYLSGYYSKDIILESAYAAGHHGDITAQIAFILGICAAALTAFYSWRLIFMTFHGKTRADDHTFSCAHESPKVMTLPLLLLSIGALFAGIYGYKSLHIVDEKMKYWKGSITMAAVDVEKTQEHPKDKKEIHYDGKYKDANFNVLEASHHTPLLIKKLPLIVGVLAFLLAFVFYIFSKDLPARVASTFKPIYLFFKNKWYFDELYNFIFVKPILRLSNFFWKVIDVGIIDRFGPNGFAKISVITAKKISKLQTGYVYNYALVIMLGLIGLIGYLIYINN